MAKAEEGTWQKVGAAAGVVGVLVAVYFGYRSLHNSHGSNPSPDHTSTISPTPPNTVSPTPTSSDSSGAVSGTEIDSGSLYIQNGGDLTYQTGAGSEPIFDYYGSLGDLDAGANVNLAVLQAPAPASNAAYQACEDVSSSNYTQEVQIDTLATGDTLCAFLPNNELAWIQFLGTSQNGQTQFGLTLHVSAILWREPST
jgi:hypothetical protein